MKTKFTATAGNGKEFTRTSVRGFTHAAIITAEDGDMFARFASSEELAYKAANACFSVPRGMSPEFAAARKARQFNIEIVEVTS